MTQWVWTVLLAGLAISIGILGRAIMLRRRGMPLPRGLWQLLALAWAGVIVLGFLLVLLPENITSALFPIAFVVGGGLQVVSTLRSPSGSASQSHLSRASRNRKIVLGLLSMAAGVVLLLEFFGQR
jgi:hypothetical protein